MAQRLEETCALLVEHFLGHESSEIFKALAQNGRLARPQLQHNLRIPGRKVRHILTVLVQQQILLYHTTDDGTTYYQVDWRGAFNLVRSSRTTELVIDRYGEGAGKIFAFVQQLGRTTVGDLSQAFDFMPSSRDSAIDMGDGKESKEGKPNGTDAHISSGSTISTVWQFHGTLRRLLKAGLLVKVGKRAHAPAADLQHEIEEIVISEHFPDRKISGPKKQTEFRAAVNNLKRKWREATEYSESRDVESKGTLKRAGGQQPNKRVKLNGGMSNGIGHSDESLVLNENVPKLPDDMVLKVNYAQCNMASRSQRLEALARSKLPPTTSIVYGALLRVLETKVKARDDAMKEEYNDEDEDDHLPVAMLSEVLPELFKSDPDIDLALGIESYHDSKKTTENSRKKPKKLVPDPEFGRLGIKQEVHSDDEDDQCSSGLGSVAERGQVKNLVEEHLKLLIEHPLKFCERIGTGGGGEYRVNFPALISPLVRQAINETVKARHGPKHAMMVNLFNDRGCLEEKQVASLTISRVKDVRAILTEMQFAGLAEVQEVPKDNSRQPGRTHYLWFHDQERVASQMLQQAYQGMARLLQRLKTERHSYRSVIEKAEMIRARQAALLEQERRDLTQWREIEEKLLIQILRIDDLVMLLRDFSGRDSSLVS